MTSLLDVSALVSLLDANHKHHEAITGWLRRNNGRWASCPITQNGYLRIVTGEKYGNRMSVKEAIRILSQAVLTPGHEFLTDDISLLDPQLVAHAKIQGPKQFTDIYLLALSVHHGGQFVTFDKRVSRVAARKATAASLHIVSP